MGRPLLPRTRKLGIRHSQAKMPRTTLHPNDVMLVWSNDSRKVSTPWLTIRDDSRLRSRLPLQVLLTDYLQQPDAVEATR
jgi:hypothetical protein